MNGLFEKAVVEYGDMPVKILKAVKEGGFVCFRAHWHERVEILYVVEGSMEVSCGNDKVLVKKGEAAFVHPRQPHTATASEEGTVYQTIMFELAQWKELPGSKEHVAAQVVSGNMRFNNHLCDSCTGSLLKKICEEYEKPMTGGNFIIIGLVYELLGYMIRYYVDQTYIPPALDERFDQALEYINKHYTEGITTGQIADQFSYEVSYFCRKFRQRTGLSMTEYVHILRLEMAGVLLSTRQDSVESIAEQCGFADVNYFIRCFRNRYDLSPAKFRKYKKESSL